MATWTPRDCALMNDIFGYDVVIDGDTGFGGVFVNGLFLYMVELV